MCGFRWIEGDRRGLKRDSGFGFGWTPSAIRTDGEVNRSRRNEMTRRKYRPGLRLATTNVGVKKHHYSVTCECCCSTSYMGVFPFFFFPAIMLERTDRINDLQRALASV